MIQYDYMNTHENHQIQHENRSSWFTPQAAIILGSILIASSILFTGGSQTAITGTKPSAAVVAKEEDTLNVAPVTKNDLVFGDVNAPVTILEYSDIECPFCNRFHGTISEILKKYDGKVKYVLRHFPLNFHPNAPMYAEAIECVYRDHGKDKAFIALNALFTKQPLKDIAVNQKQALGIFIGKEIQVDEKSVTACLNSGAFAQKVVSDTASGALAGVSGTPSAFVINKKGEVQTVGVGAQPLQAVTLIIDSALK